MTDWTNKHPLTIGQFGQISQLSRKALLLYDERGLLTPTHTDPTSGYRYYEKQQVTTARHMRLLRMMGMPLEQIKQMLETWEDAPDVAHGLIRQHVTAVKDQVTAVRLAAHLLVQELIPNKENQMSFEFTEAEVPAKRVVSIRRNITVPQFHRTMMPTLRTLLFSISEATSWASANSGNR